MLDISRRSSIAGLFSDFIDKLKGLRYSSSIASCFLSRYLDTDLSAGLKTRNGRCQYGVDSMGR